MRVLLTSDWQADVDNLSLCHTHTNLDSKRAAVEKLTGFW
jgi:hypothetical protein